MKQVLKAILCAAFLMLTVVACGGGGASADKMTVTGAGS